MGPRAAARSADELREHFLLRLLDRFEGGGLSAYEYASRVRRLEGAIDATEMANIADAPPSGEPALDVVDMLRLSRPLPVDKPGGRRPRFWWMAVMAFFFVVLLLVGLWLVAHARSLHDSGNLGSAPVAAVSAAQAPLSPVSPLSSRR